MRQRVTARAAVLREVGRPMAIERVSVGPVGPGDVLVKGGPPPATPTSR